MEELRAAAERVLCESFDTDVRLRDPVVARATPDEGYVTVARFTVEGPSDAPETVVAKRAKNWAPYDPDAERGTAWGLLNDWATLEFLGELSPGLAPRFYGGDRRRGVIVMEDLGDGDGLADLLLGTDPDPARVGLVRLAAALGRLHASTSSRTAEYERRRAELGPSSEGDSHVEPEKVMPEFRAACDHLDIEVPGAVVAEFDEVLAAVGAPGPFLALTHGDACPDNTRVTHDAVRLLDFEVGGVRHALLDGVYGHAPFPTCWCVQRVPSEIIDQMEGAYRAELGREVAAARDQETFTTQLLTAHAFWTIDVAGWHINRALDSDEALYREVHTRRQGVLLRWETFIARAEDAGAFAALAEFGRRMVAVLRERWPDTPPMPLYPAFR